MKKFNFKNNRGTLDEMQEQKLAKIEHNALWFVFISLFCSIIIQTLFFRGSGAISQNVIWETVIFLALCIYLIGACIKEGLWDRKLKANFKTNLIVSVITAGITGIVFFFYSFLQYNKFLGSIATAIFMFFMILILCISLLSALSKLYLKRHAKLEDIDEE